MEYTYELNVNGIRKEVTTSFAEVERLIDALDPKAHFTVEVTNSLTNVVSYLTNKDDMGEWRQNLERSHAWSTKPASWNPLGTDSGITMKARVAPGTPEEPNKDLTNLFGKPSKDVINPNYYQGYIQDLQWLEAMQYLPSMRPPGCFAAAVELQVRKYLDRLGGKNASSEELQKSIWYLKFLTAYVKNDSKPIRVKDIDTILAAK